MTLPILAPPSCRGLHDSVIPFLQHHGFQPVTPHIRSSDYHLCLTDPFRYWLERRMGLKSPFSVSSPLRHGSWAHLCFEVDDFTESVLPLPTLQTRLAAHLQARKDELTVYLDTFGYPAATKAEFLQTEEEDCNTVACWYSAARSLRVGLFANFAAYLTQPGYRILAREYPLTVTLPNGMLASIRPDLIFYNANNNCIYIVDLKTCGKPLRSRLSYCSLEFQTLHYARILASQTQKLREDFDVPADIQFGGVIHIGLRKPNIRISDQDRDCTYIDFTPKTGKNKGITRTEPQYSGAPCFKNYLTRVAEWYTRTGRYAHEAIHSATDPYVNISFSHAYRSNLHNSPGLLDSERDFQYNTMLEVITRYAACDPEPVLFPVNPLTVVQRSGDRLTSWGALALTHPSQWPEVIRQEHLIISHRDQENYDDRNDPEQ